MPIYYLRRLTGSERSVASNRHLGFSLAFIAGAMNAGAFLAVKQYTTHMTGITSSIANGFVDGNIAFALAGLGALLSFMVGSAVSEIMINWARNHELKSEYALPLMLEAVLLLFFGFMGEYFFQYIGLFVSVTIMLLCFTMGLQNAIITKISNAVIRTTHMTGIATDVGIEFGRMIYWNRKADKQDETYVRANREKLYLLGGLLVLFFVGGLFGAFGFSMIGYFATVPLAAILMVLALFPMFEDATLRNKRKREI